MFKTQATGKEIELVIEKIEEAVVGERPTTILMACLTLAIFMQDPHMSMEDLKNGVKGASEWIALYVTKEGMEDGLTKNQIN